MVRLVPGRAGFRNGRPWPIHTLRNLPIRTAPLWPDARSLLALPTPLHALWPFRALRASTFQLQFQLRKSILLLSALIDAGGGGVGVFILLLIKLLGGSG